MPWKHLHQINESDDDVASVTRKPNLNITMRNLGMDLDSDDLSQESFPGKILSAEEEASLLSPGSQKSKAVGKP